MATTSPSKQSSGPDQHLSDLLTNPKAFSISTYLNQALEFETSSSSPSNTFDDEDLQRRMAELALQPQVQTQSCHDEIGRIGAELRAILPRCAGDLVRLNVELDGMKEDAQKYNGTIGWSMDLTTMKCFHAHYTLNG